MTPFIFNSISALHTALGVSKPLHPLISLLDYGDVKADVLELSKGMVLNFYKISFKKNFKGKIKYGQGHYDFDEGNLSFHAPGQLVKVLEEEADYSGITLLFHPDFIRGYALASKIKEFGFFSYGLTEALYLSDKERAIMIGIFNTIENELQASIDNFSQDIMISQLEQLLNYSNRFYNRQFITRKLVNTDLLVKMEMYLETYFNTNKTLESGIPSVNDLAEHLKVSSRYLSDMLRAHTGKSTQFHIQQKLIDHAKYLLTATDLSVAEIAYQLGFERPQSFNKLFKQKTDQSPLQFKNSLN
ncbi:helix-turn-helix domain-containing protein [Leeuwenhoekiella marinoflava]|uniref:Helix-turn-helix protein n=2 Tax=Leeuwenhoekiella marinoflava TaxID=988 RepID=A0A4Q0PNX0_9FLAO|nr:AraC family transcriptional regulator [Leeuwenhoekiella marinoflava]RXG31822.1 helix-turn-helix protein [Leeuwenhoekiella marinoflava]SHF03788.1 Helix-turn-helix domain-containing protein [Leeuwenhoekiella marinoflava DSM 3653]